MKKQWPRFGLLGTILGLSGMACSGGSFAKAPPAMWPLAKKVAGKEQGLSHISGLVVDDRFAYATIGGTIADENEGTSGLRRIALDSGAVTPLAEGEIHTQSGQGGIAMDEEFVYWNAFGKILRVSKDGGKPQTVATENIGGGVDLAVDRERVYWAQHQYYSRNAPSRPIPIYMAAKQGGKAEVFAPDQDTPHSLVADEKFVYWVTTRSVMRQDKSSGERQVLFQAQPREGVDELAQDAQTLFFGFRGAGKSRWALRSVSKQGGPANTLVATYSLKPIAVTDSVIYFFDEEGLTNDVLCKVPKQGGAVVKIDKGYTNGVIAQGKTKVYVGAMFDVYEFDK